MQTRQELILDFMKAMMGTDKTCEIATELMSSEQDSYVRDIYLLSAKFADYVLERI